MNILIITPSYFPKRGGTEQVIYELVSRLKSNHHFTILTFRLNLELVRSKYLDGVEVHRVNPSNVIGLRLILNYLSLFLAAIKINMKNKFNLIHMFHVYDCGGATYLLKKILKIPLITTVLGWDTYDPYIKIPARFMPFIRMAMNASDLLTAPSHQHAEAAKKQGCKKEIKVIPLGSSMHEKVNLEHTDIKNLLNIQNKKIILSVQRLHKRKGLEYLLNAIPDIIKIKEDLSFIIVGKGPEEENLKRLTEQLKIKDNVIFAGFIEDDLLPSFYAAAELFVLPTLYESFGLVYVDALCFGVPIVTTGNSGSLDIINDKNGLLIPTKDPVKLSQAIIDALNRKWNRQTIKAGAEKYRWDRIVENYTQLYQKAVAKQ